MLLELVRDAFSADTTLGTLSVDGVHLCEVLEDCDRKLDQGGVKVYGRTAIPAGDYRVEITWSNRFKRELPILLDVPGYEGIRIHPGNTHVDTDGCLLPGEKRSGWSVTHSRAAFNRLFAAIEAAIGSGEVVMCSIKRVDACQDAGAQ